MKIYEERFEKVFNDPSTLKKCDINKVGVLDDVMGVDMYTTLLRNELVGFQIDIFKHLVKIEWLLRKFCYDGKSKKRFASSGRKIDSAFGVYMRHYVGYLVKMMTTEVLLRRVSSYMEDFFPGWPDISPFETDMPYPYKYMNFECLGLVYRMPERMELLQYGEKKQMSMDTFFDFVVNYIHSYNEEHGEKYVWIYLKAAPFVTIVEK